MSDNSWTFGTIVRRAYQVVREQGIGALFFKILGETVYRRVIVITRSLDEPVADATPRLPVEICLLDESQVEAYVRFRPDTTPAEVMRRLRAGHACYVAWWQGEIVYAAWSVTRTAWIDYLACAIELAPDTVYVYQAFAAPQVRGLGLVGAVIQARVRALRPQGYRTMLAVVMPENVRARKALAQVGYRVCGTLGYVRFAKWRYYFYRPARAEGHCLRILGRDRHAV